MQVDDGSSRDEIIEQTSPELTAEPVTTPDSIPTGADRSPDGIARYLNEQNLQRARADFAFLISMLEAEFPEIELCIRKDYLNLYSRGNSLSQIEFQQNNMYKISIGRKFYDKSLASKDSRFSKYERKGTRAELCVTTKDLRSFFQRRYIKDLCQRIKDVNYCEEISAEHILIVDNKDREDFIIIDRQIMFHGAKDIRMDLLALRQIEKGHNSYKFEIMEVKLGNSSDLDGEVAKQLERYTAHVESNFSSYKSCYEKHYAQKRALKLIRFPEFDEIKIVEGVTGLLVITGYLGTAKPRLERLQQRYPDLHIEPIGLVIPAEYPKGR